MRCIVSFKKYLFDFSSIFLDFQFTLELVNIWLLSKHNHRLQIIVKEVVCCAGIWGIYLTINVFVEQLLCEWNFLFLVFKSVFSKYNFGAIFKYFNALL